MSALMEFLEREEKKQTFQIRLPKVQLQEGVIGAVGAQREMYRHVFADGKLVEPDHHPGPITVAGRSIWDLPIYVRIHFHEIETAMAGKEPPGFIKFHDSYYDGREKEAYLELGIILPDTFRDRFNAPTPQVAIYVTIDGFDVIDKPAAKNWDHNKHHALLVVECTVVNEVEETFSEPPENSRCQSDVLEVIERQITKLTNATNERLLRWEKYATVAFIVLLIVLTLTRR